MNWSYSYKVVIVFTLYQIMRSKRTSWAGTRQVSFDRMCVSRRILNSLAALCRPRNARRRTRSPTAWSTVYVQWPGEKVARSMWSCPLSEYSATTLAVRSRSDPSDNSPLPPSSLIPPFVQVCTNGTILFCTWSVGGSTSLWMILTRWNSTRYTFRWRSCW